MTTRVKSNFPNKLRSMKGMVTAFEQMPMVMVIDLHKELVTEELNGRPINRITGNLANSFDVVQLNLDKWALKQTSSQAPYAPRVMVNVAIKRIGVPALTHLRDRKYPVYGEEIAKEFKRMVAKANTGAVYSFDKKKFAIAIMRSE